MARRKVILAFGHSNMDGEGALSDLATVGGTKWDSSGPYSNLIWYQNNVIDGLSTAGRLTPLEFTLSMFDGPPASAYDYPVQKTMPRAATYPQTFGPMLECQWQLNSDDDESYTVVQLGISGTYLTRIEPGTVKDTPKDWWWNHAMGSWHPGLPKSPAYSAVVNVSGTSTGTTATTLTDGAAGWVVDEHIGRYVQRGGSVALITSNSPTVLTFTGGWWPAPPVAAPGNGAYTIETRTFQATSLIRILVEDYLVAANALMAPDTADVVAVCGYLGTVDGLEEDRAESCKGAMLALIDYVRTKVGELDLTTSNPKQLPFVLATDNITTVFPYSHIVENGYREIAEEDQFVGLIDTTTDITRPDGTHPNGAGQYLIGQRFAQKIRDLRLRLANATTEAASRSTLTQLRTKLKRRYQRTGNSATPTDTVADEVINDALRELYNTLGDNAWFLRKIEQVQLAAPGTASTLPAAVKRLHRIESPTRPGYGLQWKPIGRADGGKLVIALMEGSTGTHNIHHMVLPLDLVTDDEPCLVPAEYIELVIVLACKRLAESAGSEKLVLYYDAEAQRLYKYVKRDVLRYSRGGSEGLDTRPDTFNLYLNPYETTGD